MGAGARTAVPARRHPLPSPSPVDTRRCAADRATLAMAVTTRQPTAGLIHHSDRSVPSVSGAYRERFAAVGVPISMAARGNPDEHAPRNRAGGSSSSERHDAAWERSSPPISTARYPAAPPAPCGPDGRSRAGAGRRAAGSRCRASSRRVLGPAASSEPRAGRSRGCCS